MSANLEKLVDELSKLSVMEAAELSKLLVQCWDCVCVGFSVHDFFLSGMKKAGTKTNNKRSPHKGTSAPKDQTTTNEKTPETRAHG